MVCRFMEEIRCAVDTMYHCLTHFERVDDQARNAMLATGYTDMQIRDQIDKPGSKFHAAFAQSPMQVVEKLKMQCPDVFKKLPEPDPDGRIRLSFVLDETIGTDGVVAIGSLTREELDTMHVEERNGCVIRKVRISRVVKTNECQMVLAKEEDGWSVITMYPGVKAPPLPKNGESDPFWDNHCFVEF